MLKNDKMIDRIINTLHRLGWVCVFFCFIQMTQAQKVYVRISPNDCINCYAGAFADILASQQSFTYIFPESYEGKRFETFNNLYFRNQVSVDNVVFSDSLYTSTEKALNGYSGVIVLYNHKIISAVTVETLGLGRIDFNSLVKAARNLTVLLNKKERGVSTRTSLRVNYERSLAVLSDILYRGLYVFDGKGQWKFVDMKSAEYQELLSRYLPKKAYQYHKKNAEILKKISKFYPEYPNVQFYGDKLYIKFGLPYIKLMNSEKGESHRGVFTPRFLSVIDLADYDELSNEKIVSNSYGNNYSEAINPRFYLTSAFYDYDDELYTLNQLIYTKKDVQKKRSFPLFSVLKLNEAEQSVDFDHYTTNVKTLDFQKDTTLNSKDLLMEVTFIGVDHYVMLAYHPIVLNLKNGHIFHLDWPAGLNDMHYKNYKLNYKTVQVWEKDKQFVVLAKKASHYFLKVYNRDWQLLKKMKLPFYAANIEKIRFTKSHIILGTANKMLRLPNFYATRY